MKPFRIFRPGKHVASCGTAVEFTEADLKRAVEAYDPKVYAAPLVIGHPKTEDRAYGWAESLSYEDGHVVAHPDKVEPTFGELVEQGAYRNRSASWYMPDHPNNPSPGNLYPKHIGFLGAVPPSLKGLGDVQFAAEEHPELVVEFAGVDESAWSIANALGAMASFMRRMRDSVIADKGVEEADRLLPDYAITDAENTARDLRTQASKATPSPAFNEPTQPQGTPAMTPEQIAALQAENDANKTRLAQFTERENALAAAERAALVDSISRSLEPIVAAGRILPAHRPVLANFMADLPDGTDAQTIEFGEAAEGQPVPKVSPRAFMAAFLAKLPKSVEYQERGGQTVANGGAMTSRQLADKAIALRAKVKADTGVEISFTEATNRVLETEGATLEDAGNTDAE